jgi:hypothetical protein
MKIAEVIWALAMPAILLLGCVIFMRIRRRTADFAEVQTYKGRLPAWLPPAEAIIMCVALVVIMVAVYRIFYGVHASLRPGRDIRGVDAVYATVGVGLIAIPAAALLANLVSWLAPPMRAANLRAMAGLDQSFAKTNRGLLLAGAVMLPIGLVDLAIAVIEPWAR